MTNFLAIKRVAVTADETGQFRFNVTAVSVTSGTKKDWEAEVVRRTAYDEFSRALLDLSEEDWLRASRGEFHGHQETRVA